jgi:hypothetical protein
MEMSETKFAATKRPVWNAGWYRRSCPNSLYDEHARRRCGRREMPVYGVAIS